jgi:hypothetical protein
MLRMSLSSCLVCTWKTFNSSLQRLGSVCKRKAHTIVPLKMSKVKEYHVDFEKVKSFEEFKRLLIASRMTIVVHAEPNDFCTECGVYKDLKPFLKEG